MRGSTWERWSRPFLLLDLLPQPWFFSIPLMKRFFMSYSHPVLTTTIVCLPGPHVSHHQWDPNVADKIISLSLCCNHIPPLFQILLCLPLLGDHTHRPPSLPASSHPPHHPPASLCLSYQLVLVLLLVLRSQLSWAAQYSWHDLPGMIDRPADVY